jgi:hypothetical protein
MVESNLQVGLLHDAVGNRWLVPEFDIDVGLAPNVEVGLDGTWSYQDPFNRAPDVVWALSKIMVLNEHDAVHDTAWAGGLVFGPKLPIGPGVTGCGYELLLLAGRSVGLTRFSLNAGGVIDPALDPTRRRPVAILGGVDASFPIDVHGRLSLDGDLSGAAFLSGQPHELHTTMALVWHPSQNLQFSMSGLLGFLKGGDQYGAFFGVTVRLALL